MHDLWRVFQAVALCGCGSLASLAQVDPPAGVPRTVTICDTVQVFTACADWVWNGTDFDYKYSRASGTGTIARNGPYEVVLRRADRHTSWPLKPGVSEYTGTFDTNHSGHGTSRYSVNGQLQAVGTWTASFAPEPSVESYRGVPNVATLSLQPTETAPARHSLVSLGEAKMEEVCGTRQIREAMQIVEDQTLHDPNGIVLVGIACGLMGACPDMGTARILDSKTGSDRGKSAASDPGSFVCRGLFLRQGVKVNTAEDAELASVLTKNQVDAMMGRYPTFVEWFKVSPLTEHHFELTYLPSSITLSKEYSGFFDYP